MKKISALLLGLVLYLPLAGSVSAVSSNAQIPERNGDYQDPEHPGLRVRVFVYEPKSEKSSLTQPPYLVCPTFDPDSSSVVPSTGWHLSSNWTYTLNTNSVPASVGSGNLVAIAGNAFGAWMGAISKVNITKTTSNTTVNRAKYDGQNIIAWGRTSGSALAVTYTWYNQSTGVVAETDTIFNQKFPWYWTSNTCTDSNSYDAQDILTHETGHWMGLNDTYTSDFVNNTMYGYGSKGEVKKDTLTTGDTLGVQAVYP